MSSKSKTRRKLRPKPNYISAIISVALVLFLLGLFAIISAHSGDLSDYFKERINIIVELKDNAGADKAKRMMADLKSRQEIIAESVQFISKEDAIELLKEDFGEDFLLLDMPNPLFDVILFNVKGEYLSREALLQITSDIKQKMSGISEIYYQESLVDSILENVERLSYFILVLGIIFVIVTIALIHNSIKLALYSNRMLIKNMELVGASWGFIQRPFLGKAALHGLISGIIACAMLAGLLYLAVRKYDAILEVLNEQWLILTFAGIIVSGILLTLLSTYLVIRRYLRVQLDDLF